MIEIQEEVQIGNVILEKGDKIEVLKEGVGITPLLDFQAEFKDIVNKGIIEFDSVGFVIEAPSGVMIPFEYKNMIDIGLM